MCKYYLTLCLMLPGTLARIMHHAARFCTSAAEARATAPTD